MPVVLVHGVPETAALWDPLLAVLGRDDVVTLQLPGFGCPRPAGFGATKEDYVTWLVGELEGIEGPIDLVGHDWGGAVFELFGVPHDEATRLAATIDQQMVDCILPLYRSATAVGTEWAPDFHDIPKPGLVLVATEDAFGSVERTKEGALRAGAKVATLEGLGHWWMLQDPAQGAGVLREFWASLA